MQGVTLGAPTMSRIGDMPKLGDRVTLGAGAAVIGQVTIGDDVFVGAHALVTHDVPANTKVLCLPGLELRPRAARNSAQQD